MELRRLRSISIVNPFPLPIFPPGGLSASVTTTVWIGVFVVAFFNLRFGWVLSGLVVPGYLIPLILLKPLAALVIGVEGILTYFCVWTVSEYCSRWGLWCNFFGRDRFFALVLASMAVRLLLDGWLLPEIGAWVSEHWQWEFDYRNNFHSFGLIIVALIANQFWKPGLGRGLVYVGTHIGCTYLLVRYGLMALTNFNIGRVEYLYEDMASSFLSTPKAYVIVITTAFLASRMNLMYGWDFNGILIPSLLTLLWYEPLRILASFVESAVILNTGIWALRTPWLKKTTIEGARKVLLFFNISFLYKLLLGYTAYWFWPDAKVTDIYGFGYLLPTLMAVKAHDKNITIRLTRATIQVSIVAALAANVIGFGLTLLPLWWSHKGTVIATPIDDTTPSTIPSLLDTLRKEQVHLKQQRVPNSTLIPLPREMELFAEGVRQLKTYITSREQSDLRTARALLDQVQYDVEEVTGQFVVLRERVPPRGWGLYVIALQTPTGVGVEVPAPLDEWGTAEAGVRLFQALRGRTLAIAGSGRTTNTDGSADVLTNPHTIYQTFHKIQARRNVLQIRGITPEAEHGLRQAAGAQAADQEVSRQTRLWITSDLPPGLNLATLKEHIAEYHITWGAPRFTNLQRDTTWTDFVELWLDLQDRRTLYLRAMQEQSLVAPVSHVERIDGYLQSWLLGQKGEIAERGTNLYTPPTLAELRFFDEEVLSPLTHLIATDYRNGQWSASGQQAVQVVNAAAGTLGYQVVWYRHQQTQQDYLILRERPEQPTRRYWGTYVLRLGEVAPYIIQVPRPLFERNSFEQGVALFERLKAQSILIGGAHPNTNLDGRADIVQPENRQNLFNLTHQVLLRESGTDPRVVLQSRAFGPRPNRPTPTADVLFMTSEGQATQDRMSPLAQRVIQTLKEDGLQVRAIDGSPDTAGFEAGSVAQALYLNQTRNKEFVVLWASLQARARYQWRAESLVQETQFRLAGIASVETDLDTHLTRLGTQAPSPVVPDGLRALLARYINHRDIIALHALRPEWPQYRFERLVDQNSGQTFLLISTARLHLPAVVNLAARARTVSDTVVSHGIDHERISHFVSSRAGWLAFMAPRKEGP